MNKEVSLIPMHPFFQRFILSIIQTIRDKEFGTEQKITIDTDFVPRVSQKVMEASVKKKPIEPIKEIAPAVKEIIPALPAAPPVRRLPLKIPPRPQMPPRQIPAMPARKTAIPPVAVQGPIDEKGEYGKISPLLNDVSVSTIECPGKDKELMIVRAGQRQKTKITLNAKEIREILEKAAENAHVPLIEGVFRANVKGFSINAVVSEIIGSRFVIKKATAYSLVE